MTNSFIVAVFVLWSTNRMDIILTPSGDEIRRSMITMRTDVYTLPGHSSVTNVTAVSTNTTRLKMVWQEVPDVGMPPVPK